MPTVGALVARNVAAERHRRGWDQKHLAARLGWTPTTVSRLETGQRRVDLDDVIALCGAFGIELWKLLDGADPQVFGILGIE